jgi:hypothetical protein
MSMSPSSPGFKNKLSKKLARSRYKELFNPEDGGEMFLRNVGRENLFLKSFADLHLQVNPVRSAWFGKTVIRKEFQVF